MLKRIHKLHFSISVLLAVFSYSAAHGASLTLEAPKESRDGSFVLKLSSTDDVEKIELYRNKDGGRYEKIVDARCFTFLSQVLLEDGLYGYKIRSKAYNERANAADFSPTIFISVNRDHQLMPNLDPTETRVSANF